MICRPCRTAGEFKSKGALTGVIAALHLKCENGPDNPRGTWCDCAHESEGQFLRAH